MGKDPSKATLDQANQALDKVDKANRDGQIRRFTGNDYARTYQGRQLADLRVVRGRECS